MRADAQPAKLIALERRPAPVQQPLPSPPRSAAHRSLAAQGSFWKARRSTMQPDATMRRWPPTGRRLRSIPACPGAGQSREHPLRPRRSGRSPGALRRAIHLEPDCFEAHFNLGNIFHDPPHTRRRRPATAMRSRSTPGMPTPHFYLAVTLEKMGRSNEAKPHWRAYQELAPNGEWADLAREFCE